VKLLFIVYSISHHFVFIFVIPSKYSTLNMSFFFFFPNYLLVGSVFFPSDMSTGQLESGDRWRGTMPRDRTPSPTRDPKPPEHVEDSATMPSRTGSCQLGSQ
jgi:hypothetical protein